MKKIILLYLAITSFTVTYSQTNPQKGINVIFNVKDFKNQVQTSNKVNGLASKVEIRFPLPNGSTGNFVFNETLISSQKIANIETFDAVSSDGKIKMKLTFTNNGMEGIMHTPDGYFFIEPSNAAKDEYQIYRPDDVKNANISCGTNERDFQTNRNGRMLSIAPFPVGTQLRKYKLAAAATGEMTGYYGSQANTLAKIVSIANATNLIYELEASMTFELATQTTNLTIIFPNAATDPFGTISASACQTSFTSMNTSGTLPYSAYGIGHTFNTLAALGGGSFSANGVAGPTPCVDNQKSRAFTQWTFDAPVSMIVSVFAHEVGHQFSAWHTYNAIGGTAGSPTFCTDGWDSQTAIEPGSGTTLMSYHNNCTNPTNYTNSGNNKLQYFNTKSLEQIFNAMSGSSGTCITSTATGNTAPVANAGSDITIPKGTPYTLNGTATDANGDALTYTWEQYDVATANDKGAMGSSINGVGGYPAVNSTTAPLFRSEQSSSSTSRTFPKMTYITNNSNNPADTEGEDLPQVARTMKFRFTVRDNKTGGGGVDSDEMIVTVNTTGPLEISNFNTAQTIAAGSSQTVTWNVNSTNTLVANVKILLSADGGNTFPYVLLSSTPNDGSQSVTIPANVVSTTQGRIKVTCEINANAEFFDVNNANITITSTCLAKNTFICPETSVSGTAGNSVFNLGLSYITGSELAGNSKTISVSSAVSRTVVNYTDNTYTTCQSIWSTNSVILMFRVSKSGNYSINSDGDNGAGSLPFSVFNSSTFNCSSFVGSNAYEAIGWGGSRTITLNECTTYYLVGYSFFSPNNITLNIQGTGDVIEVQTNQAGFNFTYAAVNQANNQISAVSSTSNFTSLGGGTYKVYGLSYINTFNPTTIVNQTMNQVYNLGSCILFSSNSKTLNVIGPNCSSTLALSGAATAGTQQASQTISSTQTIANGVNVTYRAGNSITLTPLTGSGFSAASGSVFKTQIGGCN
ncbi:MAG: 3-coathanger stack domain-containing protein [Spirosomataceae bacterium]